MTKVLLVASGQSAKEIHDYEYKANGWNIVAINNAWRIAPELWDHWFHSDDFDGEKPTTRLPHQVECLRYSNILRQYGGQRECGFSVTLNAGYYALHTFNPTIIGFLGADMNYTPAADGSTHFYGIGSDITKRGIPDPDRMVKRYGADNPNYLNDIYMRLSDMAMQKHKCKVVNLSTIEDTRLPYPRAKPQDFQ